MPKKTANPNPYTAPDPSDPRYDAFRHLLLLSERYPLLRHLASRFEAEIGPQGGVEDFLMTDLIANSWRIWRLQLMEAAMLNHQTNQQANDNPYPTGDALTALRNIDGFSGIARLLSRLESAARRAVHSTLKLLLDYRTKLGRFHKQSKRDVQDPPLPTPAEPESANPETQPHTTQTNATQTNEKEPMPCCPQLV